MKYSATAKYIRTSPRKVQLIARAIHRLSASAAIAKLSRLPKRAGTPLSGVVSSAIAGAREKKADVSALRIASIEVLPGPVMKRWHAVSKGQAHAFKKRMSHIRVTLTDDEEAKRVKSKTS